MADGRKNNGAKKGENRGQGRKRKADEVKIIEMMDAVGTPEEAWSALWLKVQDGDANAIKTWLEYRFGKPKQKVDVTTDDMPLTSPEIVLNVAPIVTPLASNENDAES
jgi:hypothetical protein